MSQSNANNNEMMQMLLKKYANKADVESSAASGTSSSYTEGIS